MKIIFIEIPEFVEKFDRIATFSEMKALQEELIQNPFKGAIVKGTGGARKIRMKLAGKGKSGGARIIYYYVDLQGEIWFLDIYTKSVKKDLAESDKQKLYQFIKEKIHGRFD
jgi:mRNA-degrading endonuclease RelE of RelBE toxin-antitoxin system